MIYESLCICLPLQGFATRKVKTAGFSISALKVTVSKQRNQLPTINHNTYTVLVGIGDLKILKGHNFFNFCIKRQQCFVTGFKPKTVKKKKKTTLMTSFMSYRR